MSDAFHPAVWQALRGEYPIRLNPKSLQGEQLGETENPNKYVQRQLKRWKQETEGNPEGDPLMATLFRNAVIYAMPQAIKSRLEDVVGLNSKLTAAHPGSITGPSKPLGRSKSRTLGVPRESYMGESASNFNN